MSLEFLSYIFKSGCPDNVQKVQGMGHSLRTFLDHYGPVGLSLEPGDCTRYEMIFMVGKHNHLMMVWPEKLQVFDHSNIDLDMPPGFSNPYTAAIASDMFHLVHHGTPPTRYDFINATCVKPEPDGEPSDDDE